MKKLVLILLSVFIILSFSKYMINCLIEETDEKNMAENSLKNTEHIKGEVTEKTDKSYMKKEGYVLFSGGGERKIEDYQIKIRYGNEQYKTIKLKENEYLDINKSDKLNIVIDSEDHSIKYNLDDDNDRKEYERYKKEIEK